MLSLARTGLVVVSAIVPSVGWMAGRPVDASGGVRILIAIPAYGNAFAPKGVQRSLGYNTYRDHFAVVVENRSRRTLDFFTDGSSWGDPTLSFEITEPDGKTTRAKNVVEGYSKNAPGTVRLAPGECWVRDVFYSLPSWKGFPESGRGGPAWVTMRAVIEQDDQELKGDKFLWVGKTMSAPLTVGWFGKRAEIRPVY